MISGLDGGQRKAVADLRSARVGAAGWRDAQRAAFDRAHLDPAESAGLRFAEALAVLDAAIASAERASCT